MAADLNRSKLLTKTMVRVSVVYPKRLYQSSAFLLMADCNVNLILATSKMRWDVRLACPLPFLRSATSATRQVSEKCNSQNSNYPMNGKKLTIDVPSVLFSPASVILKRVWQVKTAEMVDWNVQVVGLGPKGVEAMKYS